MRVYKSADDTWILWNGIHKIQYNSEEEANFAMNTNESNCRVVVAVQEMITDLAALGDLLMVIAAREIGPDDAEKLTDDTLSVIGWNSQDYADAIALLKDVAAALSKYQSTLARLRKL